MQRHDSKCRHSILHNGGAGLAVVLVLFVAAAFPAITVAQTGTIEDSVRIPETTETLQATQQPSRAGAFARGHKRVTGYLGAGRALGQDYGLAGLGVGYFIADGLEVGGDVEGWFLQSPSIWKVTPQIRYTVWQMRRLHPYLGAFWRHTFIGDDYGDLSSYGGRAGLYYTSGRGWVGAGMVYERYSSSAYGVDRDEFYPEVSFSLFF